MQASGLEKQVIGVWTGSEIRESSTLRQLEAVYRTLKGLEIDLEGLKVLWYTDNRNVVSILSSGSKNRKLQETAVKISDGLRDCQIEMMVQWIPRGENARADFLSRVLDRDDWEVDSRVFISLGESWGEYEVDRFASNYNTKCGRFNSKYWCPGTEGVDALNQDWAGVNNWIVPPPRLISRVLDHMERCRARGTLILPKWQSAPFWPLIIDENESLKSWVKGMLQLPREGIIIGHKRNGIFDGRPLKFSMLALNINFI